MLYNNPSMRNVHLVLITIMWVSLVNAMPPFDQYYVMVPCDDHSSHALFQLIGNDVFAIPYEYGVFDCSERTAYLDWFLKSHGFTTYICYNRSRSNGIGGVQPGHMWLAVMVNNSNVLEIVYVESTESPIKIYERGMKGYENYSKEDKHYDSVFHMVDDGICEDEIDWWKNVPQIPTGLTMTVRNSGVYTIISKSDFPNIST